MFSLVLDTKESSTKERRGSPKGTDFEMENDRLAQQISAIVTRCMLLRSVHQKRMMWARPRSLCSFVTLYLAGKMQNGNEILELEGLLPPCASSSGPLSFCGTV